MMTIIYVDYFIDNDNWWYNDILSVITTVTKKKTWNSVFARKLIVKESGLKKKNAPESQAYIPLNLLNWNFWGSLKPIQIVTWSPKN